MKLYDCLLKSAQLIVARADIYEEIDSLKKEAADKGIKEELTDLKDLSAKYLKADTELSQYMEQCAADLMVAPHLICWSVDVTGQSQMDGVHTLTKEQVDELVKEILTTPEEFAARTGGLMPQVRLAVEDIGLHVGEVGTYGSKWHLGIPCDDTEAIMLLHKLHLTFHKAIEAGLISVRRRFKEFRFRSIYASNLARLFLKRDARLKAGGNPLDDYSQD
jgi:hypothetical protein